MCVMLSCFSRVQLFATPWIVTRQAPLSMGFSRQECWSGLPFPSPGDLPYPRIESESLMAPALAAGFFTTSATWEAPESSWRASSSLCTLDMMKNLSGVYHTFIFLREGPLVSFILRQPTSVLLLCESRGL